MSSADPLLLYRLPLFASPERVPECLINQFGVSYNVRLAAGRVSSYHPIRGMCLLTQVVAAGNSILVVNVGATQGENSMFYRTMIAAYPMREATYIVVAPDYIGVSRSYRHRYPQNRRWGLNISN